jgi:hypothetical protein
VVFLLVLCARLERGGRQNHVSENDHDGGDANGSEIEVLCFVNNSYSHRDDW